MSAQAIAIPQTQNVHVRPFDARRDLLPVADLVELCFADSLDADGRLYIRQMRQAARNPMADWGTRYDARMSGVVWVEERRVVGNLSLIPHYFEGRRMYLIANVAVHPDYRRGGIGRTLTQAALDEMEMQGKPAIWLQVEEKNSAAVDLYRGMGFVEKLRRTSWRLHPKGTSAKSASPDISVRPRAGADWDKQQKWLKEAYPPELRWHLPLHFNLLQPGILGGLHRAFSDRALEQWSAFSNGKLIGVLTWQSSSLEADRLWLATGLKQEDEAIEALTREASNSLRTDRKVALNYPAGRGADALNAAGFYAARTLIWMEYRWLK